MTTTLPQRRLPLVIPVAIGFAWLLALLAEVGGWAEGLHHDALLVGSRSLGTTLLLFLIAWQAMIVAMMLPSSLPMIRIFRVISVRQFAEARPGSAAYAGPGPRMLMTAFLGGYVLVWSCFGALAFAGDLALHRAVAQAPWLPEHPWLITASILAFAGAFQFSSLKDRCLSKCRAPSLYLASHYARGLDGAFRLGRGHGLFCLGCCWALMLVMFAAGTGNLWWMAALTALMVYEKTGRHGARAVPVAGVLLLALAVLALLHPSWLPEILGGSAGAGAHQH